MKHIFLIILALSLFACKKDAKQTSKTVDSAKIIDSINAVRTKYNDSIRTINNKDHFVNISGNHKITFSSDGTTMSGTVTMKKVERDEYKVTGGAKSGKNTLNIDGVLIRVSEKHLNFYGKITQKVNGNYYERTKNTTFKNEGKGNFWRLQSKMNGDGFVDYIDIHY